jgi:hypothetical protein
MNRSRYLATGTLREADQELAGQGGNETTKSVRIIVTVVLAFLVWLVLAFLGSNEIFLAVVFLLDYLGTPGWTYQDIYIVEVGWFLVATFLFTPLITIRIVRRIWPGETQQTVAG